MKILIETNLEVLISYLYLGYKIASAITYMGKRIQLSYTTTEWKHIEKIRSNNYSSLTAFIVCEASRIKAKKNITNHFETEKESKRFIIPDHCEDVDELAEYFNISVSELIARVITDPLLLPLLK